MSARIPNLVFAAIIFMVAVVVCVESTTLVVWTQIGPGPGFFTVILGSLLGALAVGVAWEHRRPIPVDADPPRTEDGDDAAAAVSEPSARDSGAGRPGGRQKLMLVAAPLMVLPFIFEPLGFRVTVVLLLSYLLIYVERRCVVSSLLIAVVTSVVAFYVFSDLLAVPLPIGILGV